MAIRPQRIAMPTIPAKRLCRFIFHNNDSFAIPINLRSFAAAPRSNDNGASQKRQRPFGAEQTLRAPTTTALRKKGKDPSGRSRRSALQRQRRFAKKAKTLRGGADALRSNDSFAIPINLRSGADAPRSNDSFAIRITFGASLPLRAPTALRIKKAKARRKTTLRGFAAAPRSNDNGASLSYLDLDGKTFGEL